MSVEVSERQDTPSEDTTPVMKYEPLPDGSKMFSFWLKLRFPTADKPNLNEMYLDVIHTLQHQTNMEQLEDSANYMKSIARFMESAFFSIDRIDQAALDVMRDFTNNIIVKHTLPNGETVSIVKNKYVDHGDKSEPIGTSTVTQTINNGITLSIPLPNNANSGAEHSDQISLTLEAVTPREVHVPQHPSDATEPPHIPTTAQSSPEGSEQDPDVPQVSSSTSQTQPNSRQSFDESLEKDLNIHRSDSIHTEKVASQSHASHEHYISNDEL